MTIDMPPNCVSLPGYFYGFPSPHHLRKMLGLNHILQDYISVWQSHYIPSDNVATGWPLWALGHICYSLCRAPGLNSPVPPAHYLHTFHPGTVFCPHPSLLPSGIVPSQAKCVGLCTGNRRRQWFLKNHR